MVAKCIVDGHITTDLKAYLFVHSNDGGSGNDIGLLRQKTVKMEQLTIFPYSCRPTECPTPTPHLSTPIGCISLENSCRH